MSENDEATMELDVDDTALVLDAPARTVKYWFKTGKIPAKMPLGPRYGYRITVDSLRKYLAEQVQDEGVRAARLDSVATAKRVPSA